MEVYADNAATTKMSSTALNAMLPYFDNIYGNPSSPHSVGRKANEALRTSRKKIADCLGCDPDEIIFTSGGTEADNQAILSAAENCNGKKHIISTSFEHHAVLNTLKRLEKFGFNVELLPVGTDGTVTAAQIQKTICKDTCLVTVMYANNEIGTLLPIAEIGGICRERGVPLHTDAVQTAGHIDINLRKQNIDMLSLSAHKFGGPKGIGALYVRRGLPVSSLLNGGSQERGKRAGTENIPAIVGMAAALEKSCGNIAADTVKLLALRDRLIDGILKIPHSALNGSRENRLCGNASFCFEGIEGESLLLLLGRKGICASSGSACTSGAYEPSHVLLAIGRPPEIADGSLRISLSAENTADEIDYIITAVKESVEYLRGMSQPWKDKLSGKRKFIL